VFFLSEGRIVAEGSVDAVKTSADPYVMQFIRGEPDGPVPFHLPSASYARDLGLGPRG
jgi:phospholipid/cholesterol/gamma-HCH transport system ATP-binding protein